MIRLALISAKEYLSNKGDPKTNNASRSSSGLVSARDYLAQKKNTKPKPAVKAAPPPELTPATFKTKYGGSVFGQHESPFEQPVQGPPVLPSPRKSNFLDKVFKDNPVMRVINRPFAKAAEALVPNATMIGKDGPIPGTNARRAFAARNPMESTGNDAMDKVADFVGTAGAAFVPLGGTNAVKLYQNPLTRKAAAYVAKKVSNRLGKKVAIEATKEAIVGAPLMAQYELASGNGDLKDVAISAAEGSVMGAVGGAAFPVLGAGIKAARNSAGKSFSGAAEKDASSSINKFIDGVKNSPSPANHPTSRLVQETGTGQIANKGDEFAANYKRGENYIKQYQKAMDDQFEYLKRSMQDRGGVDQGNLIKNPLTGEVINRYGRVSNNPKWYQDYFAEHGKKPSEAELRKLAKKQVREGYRDDMGQIPPWKPDDFNAIDDEIKNIRELIPQADAATKSELRKVIVTLEQSRGDLKRSLPEGVQAVRISKPRPLPRMEDNYVKPLNHYTDKLYRETNPERALDLIPGSNRFVDMSGEQIYFSNNKDLALGQGKNKGVIIEMEAGGIQGQVDRSKPGWEMAYQSGDAEFIGKHGNQKTYQDAVKSVTIKSDAQMDRMTQVRLKQTLSSWEQVKNPDSSVTFFRPKSSPAEEVQAMRTQSLKQLRSRSTTQPKTLEATHAQAHDINQTSVQEMRSNTIPFRQVVPANKVKKPITRQQLLNQMRHNFKIPIRTGRLNMTSSTLGIYKTRSEVVRSRQHGDIQVISHEIGHHLDKKLDLADPSFDQELLILGRKTSGSNYTIDQIRKEGVAEYIRLHLTDPATAQAAAPNFSSFLESKLTKKMKKAMTATQKDVATWIDQGPATQFRGQINRTGKEAGRTISDQIDTTYTNFVDKLHPLSVVEKAANMLKTGKSELNDASQSLYKKARLFVGTPKKASLILKDFEAILKPLGKFGFTMKDLGDYAAAKHALELENAWKLNFKQEVALALHSKQEKAFKKALNQNPNISAAAIQVIRNQTKLTLAEIRKVKDDNAIESGFTRSMIKATINKFDTPEMNAIQKRLIMYNNNLLDRLVDGQVLTQEAVDAMRKKWKDYVPFFRFFDDDMGAGFGGKGFTNLTNPVKRLKGSFRDIIDPLESMIKNTFAVVNAVERNKVGLELSKLADVEGMGSYIERLDGADQVPKENIVTVFEKGTKVQYQLDPDLYRAVQGLDEDTVNQFIRLLSYPSRILRAGATLTPEFILRNPIRDQFSAHVVSNFGYNPLIDLPMGIFHVVGRTNTYKRWIMENGGFGSYISQDRNYLIEQLNGLKDERNPWAKATTAIVNPKQWLKLLQIMGEITEEGTKVGEFRRGIRKGATPEEAAFQSRDLMDFGRVGNNIRQVTRTITFLNANIQGKDRLIRAFKNNPMRTTLRAITAVTLPTIGIYLWNKQSSSDKQRETLQNAPQWLKDTYFLISVPGTDVVARIPKPFDLSPVFSNIPENIMKWMDDNDPQEAGEITKSSAISFLKVPYMLAGITPLIENKANYKFFTGGPVVPRRDQDLLPEDQFGVSTSLTARVIGKAANYSPYKIDNLVRGYGAGLGRYTTDGIDKVLEKTGTSSRPPAEEKKNSELPVINAFTVDSTGGGQIMEDFYKKFDEVTAKAKSGEKNNNVDGHIVFAEKRLQTASKSIGKLRKAYRDIQGSFKLTPKQKREQMDKLDLQMNNIAKNTLDLLKKVK